MPGLRQFSGQKPRWVTSRDSRGEPHCCASFESQRRRCHLDPPCEFLPPRVARLTRCLQTVEARSISIPVNDTPDNSVSTPGHPFRQSISAVIPVFRSKESIAELYGRLSTVLMRCGGAFEIIFVEDCGGDGAWEIIDRLARHDHRVRGLRFSRNYGQHNALLCGIR